MSLEQLSLNVGIAEDKLFLHRSNDFTELSQKEFDLICVPLTDIPSLKRQFCASKELVQS